MSERTPRPDLLDVVAVLSDQSATGVVRGQVGTIVEKLAGGYVLVEFSDENGRAQAITPFPRDELLVLRYTLRPLDRQQAGR
jgi:hypothetical protein